MIKDIPKIMAAIKNLINVSAIGSIRFEIKVPIGKETEINSAKPTIEA